MLLFYLLKHIKLEHFFKNCTTKLAMKNKFDKILMSTFNNFSRHIIFVILIMLSLDYTRIVSENYVIKLSQTYDFRELFYYSFYFIFVHFQ